MDERRKEELEWLKNRLKNISPSNRTLCLTRLARNRVFPLSFLDDYRSFRSYEIITELLAGGKNFNLAPVSDPREAFSDSEDQSPLTKITRSLTTLFRENESLIRNKGDAYFCLGFPFLEFYTKDDNYFRAPLLLLPCSLKKSLISGRVKKQIWEVEIDSDPILNELIFDAIEKGNGFKFDREELSHLRDISDSDNPKLLVKKVLEFLKKSDFIVEGGLREEYFYKSNNGSILTEQQFEEKNRNQEIKPEEYSRVSFFVCDPIAPLRKDEIPPKKNLNLKVLNYAVIGQFPTYSSSLIKDYEEYLNNIQTMSDPIVDQIILPKCPEQEGVTPITDEIIKNAIRVQEKDRFFVLPANSTQEQIVLALRELKQTGFVADGPPGTGKSQLIVNIIADSLALGKKVLVSCEKRAALDVVYKRLQGAGLIDHVLLLHSPEKERDKIFQIILDTIEKSERLVEGKAKKLKQQFEELANDVEAENKYLNEYHDELSKERANGLPLFEMYSRALTKNTELILNPELCEKYSFKEFKLLINRITSIFIDAKKYYALKMPTSIKIADSMGYAQIPSLLNEIKKLQDLFQSYTNKRHVVEEYRLKDVLDVEAVERKKNTFSEGLLSLNKLDKNDLVFKLMEGKLSVNQVEEKILTLKSIVEYLPEDFIELPVSFDSVDQECETISKYKNLLLEAYNKIYPSYQYYKKYSSKISNHTLFNKLTHYRLTPLFQEDTLEIFKYIESNKELLLNLSESQEFLTFTKHLKEIEKLQDGIKIECILSKPLGMAIWEGVSRKINYLKSAQRNVFRFFIPKWYGTKNELARFIKENLSLATDSLTKIEELTNSNISYLSLKEYLRPLYSDLEITDISDVQKIYQAIELFKDVIKSLEALCHLYKTYKEFLETKEISLIEAHAKVITITNKYGITNDVKPEKILRDLYASQIIKKNEEVFRFFKEFECFPRPITSDTLNRLFLHLAAQIDVYKKLEVIKDDFDLPVFSEKNFLNELSSFVGIYDDIICYIHLKRDLLSDINKIRGNFSSKTAEKFELALKDDNDFLKLLKNIEYYLVNYDAERQWLDISENLNEVERETVMSLCELLVEDINREMVVAYCKYWIKKLEDENIKIRRFSCDTYDKRRSNFKKKLDEKMELCANVISSAVKKNGLLVTGNHQLIHDLGLKIRKKSVRYVFKKYFEEIQKLFPAVLMSPEVVSQCLPNKTDLFDLVIFDEASQLEVYKAIPCVFRGEAIFVTGDEHQLPPNRIGKALYDDTALPENVELDNDELQEKLDSRSVESFLYQCIERFQKNKPELCAHSGKMLDWHYRSEHEALINFSNHAFYKGQIQISPDSGQYLNYRPIRYHKVNGFFIKKRNIIEAKEVVRLLKQFWLSDDAKKIPTIGVVTFSLEQQNAIWDEIDKESISNQSFAEAYQRELSRKDGEEDIGFFIRNIENVQGDQRDIIIFSIGYAPESPGEKIVMKFGIFSQEKGENRLNVAITRAKKEVHIVASIEPEELRVEQRTHDGPKYLQEYLRYCRLIDQSKLQEARRLLFSMSSLLIPNHEDILSFDSGFEQEVHDFLKSKGYDVKSQVGCSKYRIDLAVVDPNYSGRYLCGIECDGNTYHSGIDARERDIYRQSFLESKNWKILRIWSSYWFKNTEDAKNRLISSINELVQQSKRTSEELKKTGIEDLDDENDFKINKQTNEDRQQNSMQDNSNLINRCPECGSEFKVATNGYFYSLYCNTCHWKKRAGLEDLIPFIEEEKYCKHHPSIKLKIKQSVRGLFLSCPSCYYIESLKIKDKFLLK